MGRTDIGRKLPGSDRSPALKIGLTLAIFSSSGKMPVSSDLFISLEIRQEVKVSIITKSHD